MGELFSNYGRCPTCDQPTRFVARDAWLRDGYVCEHCGSIPRERALMWTIERFFPNWRNLSVHESSPVGRGASARLARACTRYASSQFLEGVRPGEVVNGVQCQDLEQLTLATASVDLFVTQDVMEHVLDPQRAFKEIGRVLAPGGAHVFTTPLVNGPRPSEVQAKRGSHGEVVQLAPASYHGNPVGDGRSLVTMHYGYDICDLIHRASGLFTTMVWVDAIDQGIRAELNDVLITRKPA